MANTRELRRRIKSVKNISQITKAMQMVAATKMRRAQAQALAGRPYTETLEQALNTLVAKTDPETHPLLQPKTSGKTGVILISTDKSLCGALNTNLFRLLQNFSSEHTINHKQSTINYYTIGKKGQNFVVKTGKDLIADFENPETVIFRNAKQVAKTVTDSFLSDELSEVYVLYPHFVSTLTQEPTLVKILPFDNRLGDTEESSEFLIEPNPDILLDWILTHAIETRIYQSLVETKASEHSARMMAMQNATDNAKELVSDLTLDYNQTRQAGITNELLEITTAQAAME